MYSKLCPLLRNNFSKLLTKYFQHNNYRNKSVLTSSDCFSYKEFEKALPKILSKVSIDNFINRDVVERVKKITECSSYEEHLFRGSLAILAYETLEKSENITAELIHQIRNLAWGTEILHSYFIILDDLNKSCGDTYWCSYDPSLLRSFIYELLRIEFADKPSYAEIVHLFDKAFLNTIIGYQLDVMNRKKFTKFTSETYNTIADLKTSLHTFQLPISVTKKMLKDVDEPVFQEIQNICLDLGRLYHMQTDYLDCYGEELDQSGIPKHSCDIQLGRCSWLAVSALQRCTPAQRIVFNSCYGSKEPAHIERVKLLYDQLHIPNVYTEEKKKMCNNITRAADKGRMVYDSLFLNVLDVIKDRDNVQ